MPPSGEGSNQAVTGTAFSNDLVGGAPPPVPGSYYHSLFTYLLPYIEQQAVFVQIDQNQYYNANSAAFPNHVNAFKTVIPIYICPSYPNEAKDSAGYGYVCYGATVYTDIVVRAGMNGTAVPVGQRDKLLARQRGMLDNFPIPVTSVTDGTSTTIMIAEDAARRENYITNAAYIDPAVALGLNIDGMPIQTRRFWRWAEQDSGFGASGDPTLNTTTPNFLIINNNFSQMSTDGPPTCNWKTTNNCGPNDEIFSYHDNGANVCYGDGHVAFLIQSTNPVVVASLVSRAGAEPVEIDN
jgi:prepilin-type processing-associated H-X9-DG protein